MGDVKIKRKEVRRLKNDIFLNNEKIMKGGKK